MAAAMRKLEGKFVTLKNKLGGGRTDWDSAERESDEN